MGDLCGRWRGAVLAAAVAVAVTLAFPAVARADGMFFPDVAYGKPPTIPTQRALMVYHGGQERLVIENSLDGQGQSFGWVIPLPAAPTEIKAATPGALRTLESVTAPHITHDLDLEPVFIASALALFFAGLIIARPKGSFIPQGLIMVLAILAAAAFFPHLAVGGADGGVETAGVKVIASSTVGSYDLTVLTAADAKGLDTWLSSGGFAGLTPEASAIASDYIKQGWVFSVCRLRREGSGLCRPHPLSFVFPAAKPVYPMRLTAIPGGEVALDLYVLADGQAAVDGLRLDYCGVNSAATPLKIGHPDLVPLLWQGAVLTKLSARLAPGDMMRDFTPSFAAAEPFRRSFYSRRGAFETCVNVILPIFCLALLAGTLALRRRAQRQGRRVIWKSVMAPAALVAAFAMAVIYVALPKVEVNVIDKGRPPGFDDWSVISVAGQVEAICAGFPSVTVEAARSAAAAHFKYAASINTITGEPIREEDSPGNYQILSDDKNVIIRVFTRWGYPYDRVLR